MTRPHHPHIKHAAEPATITPARERVIETHNITECYGKMIMLDSIDLGVFHGEVFSIVGGSGSGKTTLLHQVMGPEKPPLDTIHIFGEELTCQVGNDLQSMHDRWDIQFQHGTLSSALSVIGNTALPMRELRTLPDAFIQRVTILKLRMMGLKSTDADKMPSDLSGGITRRMALTRALSLEPELVFLNEPTVGLSPRASDDYVALIRELRQELGLTVVMVTHGLDALAALFDHIAILADRKVMAAKPLDQVIQIDHPFIEEYFLGKRDKRALLTLGLQMTEAAAAASFSTQEDWWKTKPTHSWPGRL